jgi:hypothetical protein
MALACVPDSRESTILAKSWDVRPLLRNVNYFSRSDSQFTITVNGM